MKTLTLFPVKNLFVAFCFFAFLLSVKAQSTFSISPTNTITATMDCDSSQYLHFYVVNPNAFDISLDWKVKYSTMPMGNSMGNNDGCWSYMLCDWQKCIMLIPRVDSVISRAPVPANTSNNDMKLSPGPGQNKGSGTLVIEIFERNFPSNSKTVTWNVTGCTTGNICTAGISEPEYNTNFVVYPSPAQDFVNVEIISGYSRTGSIQLYNLVGEKLMEFTGIKSNVQRIDITKLPAGAYFVKYNNGEGASVKKIFKAR